MRMRIFSSVFSCRSARAGAALVLGLALASPAAPHTSVKAQASEGSREDNALRIGHGCDPGERPVVAQSVVFPTEAPTITASDPAIVLADLSEVLVEGGLAGLVQSIQDRSIFLVQDEIVDADGNVVGFQARAGLLRANLSGRVPFQFSAPSFQPSSCARRLLVEIAVADVCSVRPPAIEPGKLNLWIPENASRFAVEGAAADIEGVGEPATLIVNRNRTTNPIPPACGAGYDVTLTPSASQLDRDLPIPGYWPSPRGRGRLGGDELR